VNKEISCTFSTFTPPEEREELNKIDDTENLDWPAQTCLLLEKKKGEGTSEGRPSRFLDRHRRNKNGTKEKVRKPDAMKLQPRKDERPPFSI